MHSLLFRSSCAALCLAAASSAQFITEIPSMTVPHSVIDMDHAGPAGSTSLIALRAAGSPCGSGLAALTFTTVGSSDLYDTLTSRGRGLAWNGSAPILVDAPSGDFVRYELRIDLSTPVSHIGLGLGDHSGALILDFFTGGTLMTSYTTPSFGVQPLRHFQMNGNTFDRVVVRSGINDGFVLTDLVLEERVEVNEMPFMLGLHSTIDMDAAGALGATSISALNTAGLPMPGNLRDIVLTPNGLPLSNYDTNTTRGRALGRNAANQLTLVDPPNGIYQPFNARIELRRSQTFGISIADWAGAFALEFYSGNQLLTTTTTSAFATANPKYYYMSGGSFDRIDIRALDANARWVIPTLYVQTGANDCCDALPLHAGLNEGFDTRGSSSSLPTWPCGSGANDIWFSYTATCSGSVRIETCGLATFDTALEAFSGPCANLSSVACNDDACTLQSMVTFPVSLGERYLVRVGGFQGQTGSVSLLVTESTSGNGTFLGIGSNCGNLSMNATGTPDIGGAVQYTMSGVEGLPFLMLGLTQINYPLCPAGCTLRVLPELGSFATSSLQSPVPCDPLLIGGTFYIQGIDLGGSLGCNAGAPAQLTVTHLIMTTIG